MALAGGSDLHQEFAVLGELHDHAVVIQRRAARGCPGLLVISAAAPSCCRSSSCWCSTATAGSRGRVLIGLSTAIAADPNVALVVDCDAVIRGWPNIAVAIASAPACQQIAGLIELQHRRCGLTAFRFHFS